jgi:MFS superfamily sulfate permease-like transporter
MKAETLARVHNVFRGNRFNLHEWAGAFGDLGTLIPFVVAYVSVVKMEAAGVLFAFGITKIAMGLFYKTPVPVQPMKAIGAAAIAQAGTITPGMVYSSGIVTGLVWLLLGLTNLVGIVAKLASKPVVRGIVLGLGLLFVTQGIQMMLTMPWLGVTAAVMTLFLLSWNKIPAMFVLLILGAGVALWQQPELVQELSGVGIQFQLPAFALAGLSWDDISAGALFLALPQIPLTLGNAIIATTAENNEVFPHRKTTERKLAISTGIMNLFSPVIGGIPLCHGAGGMAGHIRFGARTGGALVILGSLILILALFFADSAGIVFRLFPEAVLGVILFFAGTELAVTIKDIGSDKKDIYVMLITAGLAMWNMLAAFIAGVSLYWLLRRKWIKL